MKGGNDRLPFQCTDGKITFEIHYEKGVLPEVFPEARNKINRAIKPHPKPLRREVKKLINNLFIYNLKMEISIKRCASLGAIIIFLQFLHSP